MLSEKLKQARIAKGFSQEKVATELNISRQSLSKWENGRGYPDVYNLKLLCDLYEISVDQILKDDERLKDITGKEKTETKTEKEDYSKKIEMLFMIVVMLVSCLIPFLGVAVSVVVLIHIIKKPGEATMVVKLILVVCLVTGLINSLILLNELYFHIGEATII